MKFSTNYERHVSKGLECKSPSMTEQHHAADCDINTIMARYAKTGALPDLIKTDPVYGDFSDAVDYHTARNLVLHAESQFNALPSSVRNRFQNDPAQFLAFATDEKNMEEMVEMGLAVKRPEASSGVSNNAGEGTGAGSAVKAPGEARSASQGPAVGEGPKT